MYLTHTIDTIKRMSTVAHISFFFNLQTEMEENLEDENKYKE